MFKDKFQFYRLMDKAGAVGNSGGGSGDNSDGSGNTNDDNSNNDKSQSDALREMNAKLMSRIDALETKLGGKGSNDQDDPDLADKARLEREARDKKVAESGSLERALKFTMQSKDWVKTNESLLPKTVQGIFDEAEKENYGSSVEKADAIKVGIVQEFFAQQENLDLLTDTQKIALDDFKKLTKNDKQQRVGQVFDNIFEPTFEALRREKRAALVAKGLGNKSNGESAYEQKMIERSKSKYMRGK